MQFHNDDIGIERRCSFLLFTLLALLPLFLFGAFLQLPSCDVPASSRLELRQHRPKNIQSLFVPLDICLFHPLMRCCIVPHCSHCIQGRFRFLMDLLDLLALVLFVGINLPFNGSERKTYRRNSLHHLNEVFVKSFILRILLVVNGLKVLGLGCNLLPMPSCV